MALFPTSKEEGLINAIKSRPTLYDKSDKNYNNRDFVGKLWLEVGEEVEFEASSCKIKWQSLRDYFLRKLRENFKKSGQAASIKRQWYLYDRMCFLSPYVAARETSRNLDAVAPAEDESVCTGESLTYTFSQPSNSPVLQSASPEEAATDSSSAGPSKSGGKKRKKNSQDIVDKRILKALQKAPENEHELFFKSLIPTVSQLNPIQTMLFRADVQHLIVKHLRQQEASRSSTPASSFLLQETMKDDRLQEASWSSTPVSSFKHQETIGDDRY